MPEFDGILFSDLHLSETTVEHNALFDAFVKRVEGIPEIACLGDLTEYWIGRKHLRNDFGRHLFDQMERLARPAKRAIWIDGNRDFMFRHQCRQAGWDARRNIYEGEFAGVRVALEHGDRFCTLDREYQRFRLWFRNFPWRFAQLFTTAEQGHRGAKFFRSKSTGETARKDPEIYGIQPGPVERLVSRGAGVIVCGHVHAPFVKDYTGGKNTGRLYVMSDWRPDAAVVCTVKDGEFKLMKFDGEDFKPFDAPSEQRGYSPDLSSYERPEEA